MTREIIKCEICGQDTIWERENSSDPPESEHCQFCARIVCPDCFCWTTASESVQSCKDCCTCPKEVQNMTPVDKWSSRWDLLEHLRECFLEDSALLDEITRAMTNAEFYEIYNYLCRMHGIEPRS